MTPSPIRISAIDALRGFAVLGILLINIQGFAMISAAFVNPAAYGDLSGWNYVVWFGSYLFADSKFLALFSLLFGASMVLIQQQSRSVSSPDNFSYQLRRLSILIAIGMLHAYLIWPGDILVAYGLCGLAVLLTLHWSPRALLLTGVLMLSVPSLSMLRINSDMQEWDTTEWKQAQQEWKPPAGDYQAEIDAYRGNWAVQQRKRSVEAFDMQTENLPSWTLWRAGGLMLLGIVLFKWGVLTASKSARYYRIMAIIGFSVGVPLIAWSTSRFAASDWSLAYYMQWGYQINYWASLCVAAGYIGVIMLLCQSRWAGWITRPLALVGRMALTNYLLQSIFCTLVFYGHGFGMFGQLERRAQFMIVLAVWVIQILFSRVWLQYFRYGPVEWLWRSASHFQWQRLRTV